MDFCNLFHGSYQSTREEIATVLLGSEIMMRPVAISFPTTRVVCWNVDLFGSGVYLARDCLVLSQRFFCPPGF